MYALIRSTSGSGSKPLVISAVEYPNFYPPQNYRFAERTKMALSADTIASYFTAFCTMRCMIAATSARVAVAVGRRVLSS